MAALLLVATFAADCVSSLSLARELDARLHYERDSDIYTMVVRRTKVVFAAGVKCATFEGKACWFNDAPFYRGHDLMLPAELARKIGALKPRRVYTVVVDPGHGGRDPGAVGNKGTREKDVVLDVAKELKRFLDEKGVRVVMTREKDVFVPLDERARVSDAAHPDLFISIHANSEDGSFATGTETYVTPADVDARARAAARSLDTGVWGGALAKTCSKKEQRDFWKKLLRQNRALSLRLAKIVQGRLSKVNKGPDRGVKTARFRVLVGTHSPAVLTEVGFLSNRRGEALLSSAAHRKKLACAVGSALMEFLEGLK